MAAARRKRWEAIAEHIELMVLSGELPDGARLPSERELMTRFNVGRSSVREALFALQKRGLITAAAGTVARTARPSPRILVNELSSIARHILSRPEGMRHFQHARALFEVGLAREAAQRASSEDLANLAKALAANEAATRDLERFQRTDLEFHLAIAVSSHNPIFIALHNAMSEWLSEQRRVSGRSGVQTGEVFLAHKRIYEAIVAHDPPRAAAAMEEHLTTVVRNFWRAMAGPYRESA
ncbi:MAG: FCD domain-containing protein [Acetobacteraceae bacterium]